MSKFSAEQIKLVKEMQENAKSLLKDTNAFDKTFEEIFPKFDRNRDGTIGMAEYVEFINAMFTASGKQPMNLPNAMLNFDRADKDGDGSISKAEFKKELKKRLNEFTIRKY